MALLTRRALLFFLLSSSVFAGSPAWESSVRFEYHAEVPAQVDPVSIDSNTTEISSSPQQHKKRWVGIKPGGGLGQTNLWDKGHIKACFERDKTYRHQGEDKTAEEILRRHLQEGLNMWRRKGLEVKDGWFDFTFENSDSYCTDGSKRHEFLLISYAGEGVRQMATTNGKKPKISETSGISFAERGSQMVLSDSTMIGTGSIASNFAHEIGHAWGLWHEHQNPDFWDMTYSGTEREKHFFGTGSFFCDKLEDYRAVMDRIDGQNLPVWEATKLKKNVCLQRRDACDERWNFTACNWLPVDGGIAQWPKKKEPDWTSIMIYAGNMGGIVNNGMRETVMLKEPSGEPIATVYSPNDNDVKGLKKIYGGPPSKIKKLLNAFGSSDKSKTEEVRRNDPDANC